MLRFEILHRTYYNFTATVQLGPHRLRLRPREGHELRVESASVRTTPESSLRWSRDVEDNSVAIATFESPTSQLMIESHVIVQQYNQAPFDFLLADHAVDYPFAYAPEDAAVLSPYILAAVRSANEQELSPTLRARRDELEAQLSALRDRKPQMNEDDYYNQLERILVETAKLYEQK